MRVYYKDKTMARKKYLKPKIFINDPPSYLVIDNILLTSGFRYSNMIMGCTPFFMIMIYYI